MFFLVDCPMIDVLHLLYANKKIHPIIYHVQNIWDLFPIYLTNVQNIYALRYVQNISVHNTDKWSKPNQIALH